MVAVAEQRGNDRHDGQDEPGTDVQRNSPAQPPAQPMDEEQLRQFQQFQQFQDYLKFSEAQRQGGGGLVPVEPPPGPPIPVPPQNWQPPTTGGSHDLVTTPPPKIKAPRWLKRLAGKILGWIIVLVILGLALNWGYNRLFPSTANDDRPAAETGGGKYHTTHILASNPYEAVRSVYDAIAKQNPDPNSQAAKACRPMREDIQQKFAEDMGFADCRAAALGLHEEVTSLRAYQESIPSYVSGQVIGDTVTINSCSFDIKGGRSLGSFTVTKAELDQWLIVGHSNDPETCPALTTAPTPTG
jgi:hypothetical protein